MDIYYDDQQTLKGLTNDDYDKAMEELMKTLRL